MICVGRICSVATYPIALSWLCVEQIKGTAQHRSRGTVIEYCVLFPFDVPDCEWERQPAFQIRTPLLKVGYRGINRSRPMFWA